MVVFQDMVDAGGSNSVRCSTGYEPSKIVYKNASHERPRRLSRALIMRTMRRRERRIRIKMMRTRRMRRMRMMRIKMMRTRMRIRRSRW